VTRRLLAGAMLLGLLAGCSIDPAVPGSPPPGPVASSAPDASTAAPTVAAARLVLSGQGIDGFRFGRASEAHVEAMLVARFGRPDVTSSGLFCEPMIGRPWQRTLGWDVFSVTFSAGSDSRTAARRLTGWAISDTADPPGMIELADREQWRPRFADLWRQSRTDKRNQWAGHAFARLDNGLVYVADKASAGIPTDVLAGKLMLCD